MRCPACRTALAVGDYEPFCSAACRDAWRARRQASYAAPAGKLPPEIAGALAALLTSADDAPG